MDHVTDTFCSSGWGPTVTWMDSTAFFTTCEKHQWQLRAGACWQAPLAFACSISQCSRLLREDVFIDEKKKKKKNIGASTFTLTLCFPYKMGHCITSDLLYSLSLKHTIGLSTDILIRSWSNTSWFGNLVSLIRKEKWCPAQQSWIFMWIVSIPVMSHLVRISLFLMRSLRCR